MGIKKEPNFQLPKKMDPLYVTDLHEQKTKHFRQSIYTNPTTQIDLMHLKPGQTIPGEVHPNLTQIFIILEGTGRAVLDDTHVFPLVKMAMLVVPPGKRHEIQSKNGLDLITFYSPPDHEAGLVENRP
jgi:mannose-6-phosphate isomerase-like protein (cupin superfamily)